jgi:metal-responsive CopG/Arc/MetJ family transcriptional regulator
MQQDKFVGFRADAELIDAVDLAAQVEGVSRSEKIRTALLALLDVEEPTAA